MRAVSEDLEVSVKDQLVRLLGSGPTLLTSVEGLLHGEESRAVRGVIAAYPELFDLFERGFPESGTKHLWVRLKRVGNEP